MSCNSKRSLQTYSIPSMNKPILTLRAATEQDTELIHHFILKMAEYERLEAEVDTSVEALRRSLFRERQAEVVIAERKKEAVGFALFFHNFSTFRGQRGLYLEDLFIDPEHRRKGYGRALFLHLVRIARERKCRRMEWVALDWNRPAIEFYRGLGATVMEGWSTFRLDEKQIKKLSEQQ